MNLCPPNRWPVVNNVAVNSIMIVAAGDNGRNANASSRDCVHPSSGSSRRNAAAGRLLSLDTWRWKRASQASLKSAAVRCLGNPPL
eukprot:4081215-Prymnesium_polylepis.2